MSVYQKLNKDNRGSTLLFVLICMAFVGVLGTSMLSATLLNYQMKQVDRKEKDTFYTAETALDEFCTGLEEVTHNALEEAYQWMLTTYATTSAITRESKFRTKFADVLYGELADGAGNYVDTLNIQKYFLYSKGKDGVRLDSTPTVVMDSLTNEIILKDVRFIYVSPTDGYETSIHTDIRIGIEFPNLSINKVVKRGIFYGDYAIIADTKLKNATTTMGIQKVTGNVYAGAGIEVDALGGTEQLDIQADYLISRESLQVKNKGKFTLTGLSSATSNLWLSNIVTNADTSSNGAIEYINIKANCYVADDLTLNANYGHVTIEGNYYGYQTSETEDSKSSAILMNAKNAVLDLSNLSTLWVAGKSFVSVPAIYGAPNTTGAYTKTLQGESISYKGFQNAYLLPGECIMGVGHNPLSKSEYDAWRSSGGLVDLMQSYYKGGLRLTEYVVPSSPYKAVYVKYRGLENMVYLYLNFVHADAASDYFKDYTSLGIYDNRIKTQSQTMGAGRILIPDHMALSNTGNIITYQGTDVGVVDRNGKSAYDSAFDLKELEYYSKFNNLVNGLQESYSASSTVSLASNLIDYGKIPSGGITFTTVDGSFIHVDNTPGGVVELDNLHHIEKGIVISAGDVYVKNSSTFQGLIITKGNVILEGNAKVTAEETAVLQLIEDVELVAGVLKLSDLFFDYATTAPDKVPEPEKATVMITYENWKKN